MHDAYISWRFWRTKITRKASDAAENLQLNGSVKEPNTFHNYETEKITHKASYVAENLQLYRVFRFFRQRLLCMTMHLMLFSERQPIYASSCMTISGGRTEQLDIIAGFLLRHWLYKWFSQFHSCGTYSVLSQSPSILPMLCFLSQPEQEI